jgi:hypothetical protein
LGQGITGQNERKEARKKTDKKRMSIPSFLAGSLANPHDFVHSGRLRKYSKVPTLSRICGVRATFYVSPENIEQRLEGWKKALDESHEIGNHTLAHPCTGNYPGFRERGLPLTRAQHVSRVSLKRRYTQYQFVFDRIGVIIIIQGVVPR